MSNMERLFRFAKHDFLIKPTFDYFFDFAKDYQIDKSNNPIEIKTTKEEILDWQKEHHDDGFPLYYLETLVIHSKIADTLAKENTAIFHGSAIYVDNLNNGYIFTAPSGTGKSTHVNLLIKNYGKRINYINDDKPFLIMTDNNCYIYGSPWDGKARLSNNIEASLKGIFIIKRGKSNTTKKLSPTEAIMYLIKQIHMPCGEENTRIVSDMLFKLVKQLPIYLLEVDMSNDAAKASMSIMEKE